MAREGDNMMYVHMYWQQAWHHGKRDHDVRTDNKDNVSLTTRPLELVPKKEHNQRCEKEGRGGQSSKVCPSVCTARFPSLQGG